MYIYLLGAEEGKQVAQVTGLSGLRLVSLGRVQDWRAEVRPYQLGYSALEEFIASGNLASLHASMVISRCGRGSLECTQVNGSEEDKGWKLFLLLLLLLVRQMETPVSPMKVAVHRRSLRLPYSLRATGVWSGQIPFLSGS